LQGHVARLGYQGEVLGDENSTHHKTALKITYDKEYPFKYFRTKLNSVACVCERTIRTERLLLVGKVSANFCG
jgi:hypothetical protein